MSPTVVTGATPVQGRHATTSLNRLVNHLVAWQISAGFDTGKLLSDYFDTAMPRHVRRRIDALETAGFVNCMKRFIAIGVKIGLTIFLA